MGQPPIESRRDGWQPWFHKQAGSAVRSLRAVFYDPFPTVEHYEDVVDL
jgi:hypothetical protein